MDANDLETCPRCKVLALTLSKDRSRHPKDK